MNTYWVYIMASASGTLYTGMTNNLEQRVHQHKRKEVPGFTQRYTVNKLVYYEEGSDVLAVIAREKQIKGWTRAKKVALIASMNPGWRDLSLEWEERDASSSDSSA